MASLVYWSSRKVLLFVLFLFASASTLLSAAGAVSSSSANELQGQQQQYLGSRRMLLDIAEADDEQNLQQQQKPKIKSSSSKNQTKLMKATNSSSTNKNQTKLTTKSNNLVSSSNNQTKLTTSSNGIKKLNSTSQLKKLNFTSSQNSKPSKSLDPIKPITSPKNKTVTKPTSPKSQTLDDPKKAQTKPKKSPTKPMSVFDEMDIEDDDLVSEFRDLPIKFQQTLLPDLERISTTSKAYINKYNKEMTKGFKPIVGHKYAATIASVVSFAFIIIPLLLVSLIFNHFKAYFSLQKILIFIQVYLSIYFSILCLSSLVTGLEPLKFFYATSQSTYFCLQVLQTLGYILYLLLLLMYLVLVFSTECGLGSRLLGLGQTFVGYAVGLHYYVAVFHRVVLHQPPRTNWRVHGIYATCFFVICLFARAERRKKAYLEEGGEEGKKN